MIRPYTLLLYLVTLCTLLLTTRAMSQSVPVNTPANATVCVGQPVSITINCPVEFNKPSSITVLRGSSGFIIPAPPATTDGFQYVNSAVGVGVLTWKSTTNAGLYQFRTSCRGNAATSPRVTAVSYITVLPPLSLSIAASEPCGQGPVSLSAIGCANGELKWSTGETSTVLNLSTVNSSMTYSATCTVGTGCVATARRTIGPKPSVTLTPGNLTVCTGEKINLTARSETGTGYRWNTGATTAAISVTASGSYQVAVTDSRGCSTSATASVVVESPVSVTITPQSLTLCEGQTAILTALGSANITGYKWNTGATSETIVASKTGTYAVDVTNDGGCKAKAATTITVLPKLTIKASATAVCANQNVSLAATGCERTKLLWSTGATGSEIVIRPSQTTVVSATCLSSLCSVNNTASTTLTVVAPPAAPAITGSQTACFGGVISLTAVCETGTALWNGASKDGVFVGTASRAGVLIYMAICTNAVNCATSSIYSVTVAAPPVISASSNTVVCVGEPLTLTASCSTGAIVWNNAVTGNSFVVNTAVAGINTIAISCSNAAGCSNQIIRQVSIGSQSSFSLVNTSTYPASGATLMADVPETFVYIAPKLPANIAFVGSVCGRGGEFSYTITAAGNPAAGFVYQQQNTTLTVPGSLSGIPALEAGSYIATIRTATGVRVIKFFITSALAGRKATPELSEGELTVSVAGNPVINDAEIVVSGAEGKTLNLFLSDMQGRPIHTFTQQDAPALFRYQLPMSSQPSGMYILKALTDTKQKSIRILKGN